MPFDTSSMIAFQEREEEARKASMIPVGTYNWEIEKSEVTEVGGVPRLRVQHRLEASKDGKQLGRVHSEFFNWYANENSDSPTPIEQRERNLRGMTGRKLHGYMKALAECPTSTQEIGEQFDQTYKALMSADDPEEVGDLLEAVGILLEGQYLTGRITHSGTWSNLQAEKFDPRIGAAQSVTV